MVPEIFKDNRNLVIDNKATAVKAGIESIMCPQCHTLYSIAVNHMISTMEHKSPMSIDFDTNLYAHCDCGYWGPFIELDYNISHTIQLLNNKGYATKYCCEGHIERDVESGELDVSCAYIYFENVGQNIITYPYPLPKSWMVDKEDLADGRFIIRDKHTIELLIAGEDPKLIYDTWDKHKSLLDIHEWALHLPILPIAERR